MHQEQQSNDVLSYLLTSIVILMLRCLKSHIIFVNLVFVFVFFRGLRKGGRRDRRMVVKIYNYQCNHSISPLKLRVQIPLMARRTRYNIV
jgi:hypothetical protein